MTNQENDIKTLIIGGLTLPPSAGEEEVFALAKKRLSASGLNIKPLSYRINKKSVDARKKNDIKLVYSVAFTAQCDSLSDDQLAVHKISLLKDGTPSVEYGSEPLNGPVVIAGMGPAGLFCALMLAENGYRPVIIERGDDIEGRVRAVERFYRDRELCLDSNIQFGAGGAGTFSDGKLVTRINDEKCNYVLGRLHEFGAPDDILYRAKPHIGTDRLRCVIDRMARRISELGGTVRYRCRLDGLSPGGTGVRGIEVNGREPLSCGALVLAVGHSARDTYRMLISSGIEAEPKPFSVGLRIEHLQSDIDEAMYGKFAGMPSIGHAEYALSHYVGARGVYTFCMCPGGEVVAAASENGGVVVNGMSAHARDGRNANSAIAVSVFREDYGNTVQGALDYVRSLERNAYIAGGSDYNAPMSTLGAFMDGRLSGAPGKVEPTYMGGGKCTPCELGGIFPEYVVSALRTGLRAFEGKIRGFTDAQAILTGVETRTSAPLRLTRGDDRLALGTGNIYPCGEGAGYAGGITSAAVDGINTALSIMKRYRRPDRL